MVFIEPGLAEQIGTAGIDKLVAGINHVINPDYQFQEAMKVQLATNPKLAQELSDLETNAPGTLKSLGFGSLTKVLTSIPESAAGQVAREAKPEIVAGQKAQIQAKSAEAQFQGKSFADALASIKGDDPASVQLRHELINRVVTGSISPQEDVALKKAQAQEQESRAAVLKAQEPGVIAKAQIESKKYQHIIDNFPKIAAMNPYQITKDLMAGKDPGDLYGFLSQGPEAAQALSETRLIFEAQAARDQRLLMWAQIHANKDPEHAANIQAARQMFLKTGGTGTIAGWYTAITEPEEVQKVIDKANSGAQLTPDEQNLVKIGAAQSQQQAMITEGENRKLQSDVLEAYTKLRISAKDQDNPAAIAGHVDQLNAALSAQEKVTGRHVTAVYGPEPDPGQPITKPHTGFFGGTTQGVFFVDANGVRIDDNKVFSPDFNKEVKVPVKVPTAPSATPSATAKPKAALLSPRAKNFWDQYSSDTSAANRAIRLNELKTRAPNLYKEIEPLLK